MNRVQILNLGGTEVMGITTVRHAHRMIMRGVAVVHSWVDEFGYGGYGIPRAVELVRYVFAKWKYSTSRRQKVYSKRGVLERDGYRCAYCNNGKGVTIDHILPRALGGPSTWMNCVASCIPCNRKKKDMTLEESGMVLLTQPYEPS